jgi:hypothetical protein
MDPVGRKEFPQGLKPVGQMSFTPGLKPRPPKEDFKKTFPEARSAVPKTQAF